MKNLILFLSLSFVAGTALGSAQSVNNIDQEIVREFQTSALSIPRALIAAGITSFGHIELPMLIQQMNSIQLQVSDTMAVDPTDTKKRVAARWHRSSSNPAELTITISRKMWKKWMTPDDKAAFALSIYLQASSYQDLYFDLSTSMWFLGQELAHPTLSASEFRQVYDNAEMLTQRTASAEDGQADLAGSEGKVGVIGNFIQENLRDPSSERVRRIFVSYQMFMKYSIEASWGSNL
jgi:hypothetical protein